MFYLYMLHFAGGYNLDQAFTAMSYKAYTSRDLERIPQLQRLSPDDLEIIKAISMVLPFRVNNYVLENLINWDNIPSDPIFQLTFPQPEMLAPQDLNIITRLIHEKAEKDVLKREIRKIQMKLNPHPADQLKLNLPKEDGKTVEGIQHKYRETVLFFPAQGQTCHAYCTYCFRWAQFIGIEDLKLATREAMGLVNYLHRHPEVTDVLVTGGDPMIMKTRVLRRYIEPLLAPEVDTLKSIRIGTKGPAYWPYRFVTDPDADDLLRLFEEVVKAGKHLAVMAHYSHPRELDHPVAREAVRRILSTGAVIRCQAPLIKYVNDDAETWRELWQREVDLGMVPYYMFVERDTGPNIYFEVPLVRAHQIFSDAFSTVSGLGRTVRGPSMSTSPGKVLVDGITEIAGRKYFVLKFIQARNPAWVNKLFYAEYDENAHWLTELKPAFGEESFFFENEFASWKKEEMEEESALAGV
jgi:KamA family protein